MRPIASVMKAASLFVETVRGQADGYNGDHLWHAWALRLAYVTGAEFAGSPLKWTKEPPTVAGWYWVGGVFATVKLVEVAVNMWNDGFTVWHGRECDNLDNGDYDDAEWCGPIVPPEG